MKGRHYRNNRTFFNFTERRTIMKLTNADARAAARNCNEVYSKYGNGSEYTNSIEDFRFLVTSNPEMTEQEKNDVLWTFEHNR